MGAIDAGNVHAGQQQLLHFFVVLRKIRIEGDHNMRDRRVGLRSE